MHVVKKVPLTQATSIEQIAAKQLQLPTAATSIHGNASSTVKVRIGLVHVTWRNEQREAVCATVGPVNLDAPNMSRQDRTAPNRYTSNVLSGPLGRASQVLFATPLSAERALALYAMPSYRPFVHVVMPCPFAARAPPTSNAWVRFSFRYCCTVLLFFAVTPIWLSPLGWRSELIHSPLIAYEPSIVGFIYSLPQLPSAAGSKR